jgi:hypothetical protein
MAMLIYQRVLIVPNKNWIVFDPGTNDQPAGVLKDFSRRYFLSTPK